MKRRFTILTAALALLTFLAVPMGMWGQTTTLVSGSGTSGYSIPDGWSSSGTVEGGSYLKFDNGTITSPEFAPHYGLSFTYSVATFGSGTNHPLTIRILNASTNAVIVEKTTATPTGSNYINTDSPLSIGDVAVAFKIQMYAPTGKGVRLRNYSVTGTPAGDTPPTTYTITFDEGSGSCSTSELTGAMNTSITLPSAFPSTACAGNGWTFAGWATSAIDETTTAPTLYNGNYTISGDETLYAVYSLTNGQGGGQTVFNFAEIAEVNSWQNGVAYTPVVISPVTIEALGGGNNGKWYTTGGGSWRMYSGGTVRVSAGDNAVTAVTSTPTCSFTISNGVATFSPSARTDFTNITVSYETSTTTYATSPTCDSSVATTTTISVPANFNTDIHNGANAGTLSATVTAGGSPISGATVTWESSNTSVATIAANGAVTLVAVGTTNITASYAGVEGQYRPSSDTYELTVTDSYAPGTENNPYTVAQARAAIDANTGITGVYATGIISQVDSYNNNTITYWISDDGTTTNHLEVYKGKNLNNTNFTALTDVEVGATVIVYGTLTKYNTTYEFTSGNYLTSYTAPVHAVEAPTFNPVAGTYTEAQTVTISCGTSGASIYYTTDGTEPDNTSTQYTTALTISTTTTIKAVAYDGTNYSNVTTATYHFCSAEDPYTVTEALAFNEYPANNIYVSGIVSTAPTSLSSGTLTYYISADGTTTNELEVYKGKDLENANFTAVDDIQVGDIVTVYGNVVIYGTTNPIKEFAQGNYLVSFERPAQQYNLTVTPSANVEIYTFVGDDPTQEGQAGAFTTQVYDDTTVGISVSAEEGYVLTLIVDGTDVTSQLDETGWYEFTMPAHDVTVTATASLAPVVTTNTYTLATSIESGKQYIIVGQANGDYYAMGNDKGNNRYAYGITLNGTTATADIAETGVHEFTIGTITEGYYFIMDATTSGGYLYAAGSGSGKNYLKTESALDENDNGKWAITFATDGTVAVIAQGNNPNNQMRFNNSSILFSCYSTGQHPVYLYQKVEPQTYTKTINGYGTNPDVKSGWYLISSPIGTVNPANVTNMLGNEYDLYRFNQAPSATVVDGETVYLEWENYKQEGDNYHFNLEAGHGYLYANSGTNDNNNVTLTFTGTPYNQTGSFDLVYSTANTDENMHGWNLMGNPFPSNAKVSKSFYKMNSTSDGINADPYDANSVIASMEGVFVLANQEGEKVTFTATNDPVTVQPSRSINLYVNRNGEMLDRAVVSFNAEGSLCKLFLSDNTTKLYFRQGQKDYAIVASPSENEVPVSFKASRNGSYTLTVNAEDLEMNYLHLIDNMTGNDIDLLQTPSYTFDATTKDYESRFRLVFAANNVNDASSSETFAFYSNGNWIVNNNAEAVLQLVDLTGRVISSETINGTVAKAINATPGIYMLRLMNNNEVKTQKILVK